MNFDEFNHLVEVKKNEKPMWFASEHEPVATERDLKVVEGWLSKVLPGEYRLFLKKYGGGYFGLINVFSANDSVEWGAILKNSSSQNSKGFLAISDDESGGYFGFILENSEYSDSIYCYYPDESPSIEFKYNSFFEYVAKVGLRV